jgi:acetamidase/formamidase
MVPMGIDADLDVALQIAATQAIGYLRDVTKGALSVADAYALCSVAVDFTIAEAVDGNKSSRRTSPSPCCPERSG